MQDMRMAERDKMRSVRMLCVPEDTGENGEMPQEKVVSVEGLKLLYTLARLGLNVRIPHMTPDEIELAGKSLLDLGAVIYLAGGGNELQSEQALPNIADKEE